MNKFVGEICDALYVGPILPTDRTERLGLGKGNNDDSQICRASA